MIYICSGQLRNLCKRPFRLVHDQAGHVPVRFDGADARALPDDFVGPEEPLPTITELGSAEVSGPPESAGFPASPITPSRVFQLYWAVGRTRPNRRPKRRSEVRRRRLSFSSGRGFPVPLLLDDKVCCRLPTAGPSSPCFQNGLDTSSILNRSGRALRPACRGYYDLSKSRSSKRKIAGGSTCIRANSEWTGLRRKLCSPAITKDGTCRTALVRESSHQSPNCSVFRSSSAGCLRRSFS